MSDQPKQQGSGSGADKTRTRPTLESLIMNMQQDAQSAQLDEICKASPVEAKPAVTPAKQPIQNQDVVSRLQTPIKTTDGSSRPRPALINTSYNPYAAKKAAEQERIKAKQIENAQLTGPNHTLVDATIPEEVIAASLAPETGLESQPAFDLNQDTSCVEVSLSSVDEPPVVESELPTEVAPECVPEMEPIPETANTLFDVSVPEEVKQHLAVEEEPARAAALANTTLVDARVPGEVVPALMSLTLGELISYAADGSLKNECSLPPRELIDSLQAEPSHVDCFLKMWQFAGDSLHNPVLELSSGLVAVIALEHGAGEKLIQLYIGKGTEFSLFPSDDDSFEGTLAVDELYQYQTLDESLTVTLKTAQQLAPPIAGRKMFPELEFKTYEKRSGGVATFQLKKSRK